jgi:hypothetical protein
LPLQPLLAGKGQQMTRQRSAALGRPQRGLRKVLRLAARHPSPKEFEIANDRCEEIVEVVRDAGRQVADGLDFPLLKKRLFGLLAVRHFRGKQLIGLGELPRAVSHPLLERLVHFHDGLVRRITRT